MINLKLCCTEIVTWQGEVVFEGLNAKRIQSAMIHGKTVRIIQDDKRIVLLYNHDHKNEMILNIKIH